MDPLGLAQTTLALGLFPGGVVLALAGWLAARLAGRRGGWALDRRELFVLLLLDLAVAQAPVAGSPIASLPPGHGASANIAVVAAVVAAALVAASRETARGMRVAAAVVVVAAALALAVGAASLSLPAITGHPGGAMLAARAAAAAALLTAAPVLTAGSRLSVVGEAIVLAGLGLLAFSLVTPAGLPLLEALLAAGSAVVAAVVYAVAVLRLERVLAGRMHVLGVVWCLAGAGTVAAAVVAAVG